MKIILFIVLSFNTLFANEIKIYFYSTDIHINNFKSLKISFDSYLSKYGKFQFQSFNDKETFEKQIKNDDSILIISSWHYKKLNKNKNFEALLVAEKKGSVTDKKILVGRKNSNVEGLVSSAYDISYTKELLTSLTKKTAQDLPILIVPKEIDALMSVSFHMSNFALVSKDSLNFLKSINPSLSKNLEVFYESKPKYRIVLAKNKIQNNSKNIVTIFNNMSDIDIGKNILEMMGIEKFVILTPQDKNNLGEIQ